MSKQPLIVAIKVGRFTQWKLTRRGNRAALFLLLALSSLLVIFNAVKYLTCRDCVTSSKRESIRTQQLLSKDSIQHQELERQMLLQQKAIKEVERTNEESKKDPAR